MQSLLPDNRTRLIAVMLILAALSRLLPHPDNFAPIGAIALFGGCYINNKRMAFFIPMAIMFFTDLMLQLFNGNGFHPIMLWVYASFAIITCLGFYLRGREQRQNIMVASLTGSIIFFLVTNFGQWATGYYGYDNGSLIRSFVEAIPFFRGTIMGDLFYNLVLFGSFALIKSYYPSLSKARVEQGK